jgi:hypothetical protein
MVESFLLARPEILAELRLGWLALFAAPALLAAILIGIIMVTVWLTGGLHGGR